jgi:hypothetical protein
MAAVPQRAVSRTLCCRFLRLKWGDVEALFSAFDDRLKTYLLWTGLSNGSQCQIAA